jgi:hypothetical protein
LVLVSASLLLAAMGSAGTAKYDFQVFGPPALQANGQGFVAARFTPSSSSGAATHTVITFTFPAGSISGAPSADPGTSPGCAPGTGAAGAQTIVCTIGTVQGGVTVKRFVDFTTGTATPDPAITAAVDFDGGSSGAKGGGSVNSPELPLALQIVDGTSADGKCSANGSSVSTSAVNTTVPQSTALTFGTAAAALTLPCSYGNVSVFGGSRGKNGAPEISSVAGPTYGAPAMLTLTFGSLPVPLAKYVLEENESFDPAHPTVGWFPVPNCPTPTTMPADTSIDACLVGYDKAKVIVAHLLYRGTGGDPYFN